VRVEDVVQGTARHSLPGSPNLAVSRAHKCCESSLVPWRDGRGEVGAARGACSLVDHDGELPGDDGVGGGSDWSVSPVTALV
jgi:hypothetical protein